MPQLVAVQTVYCFSKVVTVSIFCGAQIGARTARSTLQPQIKGTLCNGNGQGEAVIYPVVGYCL